MGVSWANHAGRGSAGREKREIRLCCQLSVPWPKELLLSQKTLIFPSRFHVPEHYFAVLM